MRKIKIPSVAGARARRKELKDKATKQPRASMFGLGASLLMGAIDGLVVQSFVDELRRLWSALQSGEPVKHVFYWNLREGLLYIRKNPGSASILVYVVAKEFAQEALSMQSTLGWEGLNWAQEENARELLKMYREEKK